MPQDPLNPYSPPLDPVVSAPRSAQPLQPPARGEYRPWGRPRSYVVFCLGLNSIGMLSLFFTPHTIVFGLIALGLGIPAFVLANREIAEHPEAADFKFIRIGRLCGKLGLILGPIASVLWVLILVLAFRR